MNISIPDQLRDFVEEQVGDGRTFRTPSDYISALVLEDMKRRRRERVDALLLESLETETQIVGPNWKDEVRAEARKRREMSDG